MDIVCWLAKIRDYYALQVLQKKKRSCFLEMSRLGSKLMDVKDITLTPLLQRNSYSSPTIQKASMHGVEEGIGDEYSQ